MQKPMNNVLFRLMSLEFSVKAMLSDPAALLEAAGVAAGMTVERSARRAGLANLETLASDCALPLREGSIDFVLLYDTLHDVEKRDGVVRELLRVLKVGGILSYRDHSLAVDSAFAGAIAEGLLESVGSNGATTKLRKAGDAPAFCSPPAPPRPIVGHERQACSDE